MLKKILVNTPLLHHRGSGSIQRIFCLLQLIMQYYWRHRREKKQNQVLTEEVCEGGRGVKGGRS